MISLSIHSRQRIRCQHFQETCRAVTTTSHASQDVDFQETRRGQTVMPIDNVADLIAQTLIQAGVKRIFGVVGDSLNGLTEALRKRKTIDWIHVRHEEVAAFAAAGEGADVDQEGEHDDEPLEARDPVRRGRPHRRVGEGGPGQQEEAEQGEDPAVEGAAEQVAEQEEQEQREAR